MIKVYQIQLTDEEINEINNSAEMPASGKIKAFMNRSFDTLFKAEDFQYYTHVANVDVDGFEQAFRAMNLWEDDENFFRIDRVVGVPCSSMSVGDIVADHDGTLYRCASFGFERI